MALECVASVLEETEDTGGAAEGLDRSFLVLLLGCSMLSSTEASIERKRADLALFSQKQSFGDTMTPS